MRSFGIYYKSTDHIKCPALKDCPIFDKYGSGGEYGKGSSEIIKQDSIPINENELVEVHMNLWKVQKKRNPISSILLSPKYLYILDLGFIISPRIRDLALYLPFKCSGESISDLGERICHNQVLGSLIFNQELDINCSCSNYHTITFPDGSLDPLNVYPIGETNLKVDDSYERDEGTVVYVALNSKPQNSNHTYIRIRILLSTGQLDSMRKSEFLSNDILQSLFSQNELYDIRINDNREINKKVDEKLRYDGYKTFGIKACHVFFMSDTRNTVSNSSLRYNCRFLETDKWKDYIDSAIPVNMLAYHWKKCPDQNTNIMNISLDGTNQKISVEQVKPRKTVVNFRLYFSLSYPHRSNWQIIFYCLLAVFLGAVGSIISTIVIGTEAAVLIKWSSLWFLVLPVIAFVLWCILKDHSKVKFRE